MKKLSMACCSMVFFTLIFIDAVFADDLFVVPVAKAVGNAESEQVLTGKTFSNSSKRGLTGTRPYSPVADTGAATSRYPGDDASYKLYVGASAPDRFTYPFVLSGGGRFDPLTGLYWEINPPYSAAYGWQGAINRCEALTTNGVFGTYTDWRLPNLNELLSIIDRSKYNPALPDNFSNQFEGGLTYSGDFWTSTPYAVGNNAWVVNLSSGGISLAGFTGEGHFSLCVRGQYFLPIMFPLVGNESPNP
jgi:hypothetical protein